MISIIVPVYNAQNYLVRCIESILAQDFSDWELLLINDGSTDKSGDICNKYGQTDNRIQVIHQRNQGVSFARNEGIIAAKGTYITFVDADDYVNPCYLNSLITNIKDADLSVNGIVGYDHDHNERFKDFFESTIMECKEFSKDLQNKFFLYTGPYCKLFKSNIIKDHKLSFPVDISYGEDSLFFYTYLKYCKKIAFTETIGYVYTVNSVGNLSSTVQSPQKLWLLYRRKYWLYEELKTVFPFRFSESDKEKLGHLKSMFQNMCKTNMDYRSRIRIIDEIKEDSNFCFMNIECKTIADYVFCFLFKRNNPLSLYFLSFLLQSR